MLREIDCTRDIQKHRYELCAGKVIFESLFDAEIAGEHADKAVFIILILSVALRDHKLHLFVSLVAHLKRKYGAGGVRKKSHNVFFCVLVDKSADQKVVELSAAEAVQMLRRGNERDGGMRIFGSRCEFYYARGSSSRITENDIYRFHNIPLS